MTRAGKALARLPRLVKRIEDEFLAPLDAEDTRDPSRDALLTLAENTDSRFVLDAAEPEPALVPRHRPEPGSAASASGLTGFA